MSTPDQNDFFAIGSVVACVTCQGNTVKGEVVAFDAPTKMLMLKSMTSTGKSQVQFLNLGLVSDIKLEKEAASLESPPIPKIDCEKIQRRTADELAKRKRQMGPPNVSRQGLKVFHAISKTINDVSWEGNNIAVLKCALIQPPYGSENVTLRASVESTTQSQSALSHIRKLVDKHLKDESSKSLSADMDSTEQPSEDTDSQS